MAFYSTPTGTAFPRDSQGHYLELLTYADGRTLTVNASTSANTDLPTGTSVFTMTAGSNCWVRLGTSGTSAAKTNGTFDFFLPAGCSTLVQAPYGTTHVAAISDAVGALYISGRY